MKNLKNLLGDLWNSKQDSYSESEHPTLQKAIDLIKNKYIRLTAQVEKGYYKIIDMDIHLQRRRTDSLFNKLYSNLK